METGYVSVGEARLYYETSGQGTPFVMIHAGVADNRQWNREFAHFAGSYRVIRYDMRCYGRSQPAPGDYSNLSDLSALLDHLQITGPMILMGCSMGGGLCMDFALANPGRVRALVMVGSVPSGLDLDLPRLPIFDEIEKAFDEGDDDRVAELETHLWFDGLGRDPRQVSQRSRSLAAQMNRIAIAHERKNLGNRLPDTEITAANRLEELHLPVLVIVGAYDNPYTLAAADYMVTHLPDARKVVMEDAAHLPNMDHADDFRRIVEKFLQEPPVPPA